MKSFIGSIVSVRKTFCPIFGDLIRARASSPVKSQKRPTFLPIRSDIPSATSAGELPGTKSTSSPSLEHSNGLRNHELIDENRRLRYRLAQMERREAQFTQALDKLQVRTPM